VEIDILNELGRLADLFDQNEKHIESQEVRELIQLMHPEPLVGDTADSIEAAS
jgi:hypothetical protein